ncbi:MAG TPA: alkaline phosphatase family protein [bacterium]|nr:alkaline phosphatase family protein [bacterium]
MPNLQGLIRRGTFGLLESVVPPITVPAWACMVTGRDPGALGIYGFRNRKDHSYDGLAIAMSHSVSEPTIWDRLGAAGLRSVVVGVPPSFPPKPLRGLMVSCFLTPSAQSEYTWPASLKPDLEARFGEYLFDVTDFRTEDKSALLRRVHAVTAQKFAIARHLAETAAWDFLMFVDMGPDRLHHGFWKYWDRQHIKYQAGNPFEGAFPEYYAFLDRQIGELLGVIGEDTAVLVVSDHGAKRMDGAICVNEWLRREGYLTLREPPRNVQRLEPAMVDWSRTRAWGEGGYYSRIFLNVKGREPQGVVDPAAVEGLRTELIQGLEALGDEAGRPIGTRVYRPEELYPTARGVPPDLIAIFGDLYWRSVGSVGLLQVWTRENDTGPDDANHAQSGMFVAAGLSMPPGQMSGMRLLDIAPLLARHFELDGTH